MSKPKLEPLKEFICDECGKLIEEPGHGWVEWLYQADEKEMYKFRIVHHKDYSPSDSCYISDRVEWGNVIDSTLSLDRLLGDAGLTKLLGVLQDHFDGYKKFKNEGESKQFLELVRRLQIPYYEEGRFYLDNWTEIIGDSQPTPSDFGPETMLTLIEETEEDKI